MQHISTASVKSLYPVPAMRVDNTLKHIGGIVIKKAEIERLAERFRAEGYEAFLYNNSKHIRILRRRTYAPYQGPRCISWWPLSRRQTAHDENCGFTWTKASFKDVLAALEVDEELGENTLVVS